MRRKVVSYKNLPLSSIGRLAIDTAVLHLWLSSWGTSGFWLGVAWCFWSLYVLLCVFGWCVSEQVEIL